MDPSVDLRQVARKTSGFAGADLANVVNESALAAVRAGRSRVLPEDLDEAIEKAVSGLRKKRSLISAKEKRIVAFHEAGHALIAELTPGADKVEKISIIPRGFGALGFTMQMPIEDRYLMTESELLAKVDVLLGGRAAEKAAIGEASSGAADDLTQATEIARRMVMEFGMSERFRDVALHAARTEPIRRGFQEPSFQREYAEATQQYVDEEVARIIRERGERVAGLVASRREILERAAGELLHKETLSGTEFRALLRSPAGNGSPPEIPAAA
jgi:cell division protease FtsH